MEELREQGLHGSSELRSHYQVEAKMICALRLHAYLVIFYLSFGAVYSSTIPTQKPYGHHLTRRGDCRIETVRPGDSCGLLAKRCGISPAVFTQYNPDPKLCSTLQSGTRVCCVSIDRIGHLKIVPLQMLILSHSHQVPFQTSGRIRIPTASALRIPCKVARTVPG